MRSPTHWRSLVGRLLVPACGAFAVAGVAVWSEVHQRAFLIAVLAIIIPLPIVVRILQRRFDPFEPGVLLSLSLTVLFVLRPIAHLAYGEMKYGGVSIDPGFNTALVVAVVGVSALYIGYATGLGRSVAQRLRPLPAALKPEATMMIAGGLVIFGLVLFALYVEQVGGVEVARRLLRGRNPQEGQVTGEVSVYFLFGPFLAIPATLLLLEAAAEKRRGLITVLVAGAVGLGILFLTGPRGDRLWLMILLLGVFVLPYLRKQKRPRIRTLALVGIVWFAFGITFLADVRVPIAREAPPVELLKKTASNPFRGWHDFALGADTEMFSILALEASRVPSTQPHEPGITILSLTTNWIPRRIYPNKPVTADEKIYGMLFPVQATYSKAGTAPSIFGGFYYDAGLLGVLIGSFLIGVLARALFEYLMAYPNNVGVRLVYASTIPFIFILVRGNPTDTIARMGYIVFPIILALLLAGHRDARPARRAGATARALG